MGKKRHLWGRVRQILIYSMNDFFIQSAANATLFTEVKWEKTRRQLHHPSFATKAANENLESIFSKAKSLYWRHEMQRVLPMHQSWWVVWGCYPAKCHFVPHSWDGHKQLVRHRCYRRHGLFIGGFGIAHLKASEFQLKSYQALLDVIRFYLGAWSILQSYLNFLKRPPEPYEHLLYSTR